MTTMKMARVPEANGQFEVVDVNVMAQEVEVRLRVNFGGDGAQDVDRLFWVSRYDFPMLDNNNVQIADLLSRFIKEKGLDRPS